MKLTLVLTREALTKDYVALADHFTSLGTSVLRIHEPSRTIEVDAAAMVAATELPQDLNRHLVAKLGLNQKQIAKPYFRKLSRRVHPYIVPRPPRAGVDPQPMTALQVAQLYGFPSDVNGSGQTIALIELGGGYTESDLTGYWDSVGIKNPPKVTSVSIDGATNSPGTDADAEVALDIQVAGAVAPGATIAAYFAPNTDQGFLDAINAAIHHETPKPSVISISWGGPEDDWDEPAMIAMDMAFEDAAIAGISVLVASGDNGSSDGETGNHVDFPASAVFATGCGGTQLIGRNGEITAETVWNDGTDGGAAGGGQSTVFDVPAYQRKAPYGLELHAVGSKSPQLLTMRGVPDVSGNADPNSGYEIFLQGQIQVVGGTSAVAPLYAGLVALLNQKLGHSIGFLNSHLYRSPSSLFRDITTGNNGSWEATHGWDGASGLGSIDGPEAEQFLA